VSQDQEHERIVAHVDFLNLALSRLHTGIAAKADSWLTYGWVAAGGG
jgi:hypothetical protein